MAGKSPSVTGLCPFVTEVNSPPVVFFVILIFVESGSLTPFDNSGAMRIPAFSPTLSGVGLLTSMLKLSHFGTPAMEKALIQPLASVHAVFT